MRLEKSITYYKEGAKRDAPKYINDKAYHDRLWADFDDEHKAHSSAYYYTVSGGESGSVYKANLVIAPPFIFRGDGNTFRNYNLDYFFLTSELASLKEKSYIKDIIIGTSKDANFYFTLERSQFLFWVDYSVSFNAEGTVGSVGNQGLFGSWTDTTTIENLYELYALNTMGALEQAIKIESNGQLDTILPYFTNGVPDYRFVSSEDIKRTKQLSPLYHPIVVSQGRYQELIDNGYTESEIVIDLGLVPTTLSLREKRQGYYAKISLSDKPFNYPISRITIDDTTISLSYKVENGNLYFYTSPLPGGDLPMLPPFGGPPDNLGGPPMNAGLDSILGGTLLHIYFHTIIPIDNQPQPSRLPNMPLNIDVIDTKDDNGALALAQTLSYSISDYFNQYYIAATDANFHTQFRFTWITTIWSTLFSTLILLPVTVGASMLTSGKSLGKIVASQVIRIPVAIVEETWEELYLDPLIERYFYSRVQLAGGSEELATFISMLATSVREGLGGVGSYASGKLNLGLSFSQLFQLSNQYGDSQHQTAFTETNLPIFSLFTTLLTSGFTGGFGALSLGLASLGLSLALDFASNAALYGVVVPVLDQSVAQLMSNIQNTQFSVMNSITLINSILPIASQLGIPGLLTQQIYSLNSQIQTQLDAISIHESENAKQNREKDTRTKLIKAKRLLIQLQNDIKQIEESSSLFLEMEKESYEGSLSLDISQIPKKVLSLGEDPITLLLDSEIKNNLKVFNIPGLLKLTIPQFKSFLKRRYEITYDIKIFDAPSISELDIVQRDYDRIKLLDIHETIVRKDKTTLKIKRETTLKEIFNAIDYNTINPDRSLVLVPLKSHLVDWSQHGGQPISISSLFLDDIYPGYAKLRDEQGRTFEGEGNVVEGFGDLIGAEIADKFYYEVIKYLRVRMKGIFTIDSGGIINLLWSWFDSKLKSKNVQDIISSWSDKNKAKYKSEILKYFEQRFKKPLEKMNSPELDVLINKRLDEIILRYLMEGIMDTFLLTTDNIDYRFKEMLDKFNSRGQEYQLIKAGLLRSSFGLKIFLQNFIESFYSGNFDTVYSPKPFHNPNAGSFIGEISEGFTLGDVALPAMAKAFELSGFKNIKRNNMADIFHSVQLSLGKGLPGDYRSLYNNYFGSLTDVMTRQLDNNDINIYNSEMPSNKQFFDVLVAIFQSCIVSFENKHIRGYADEGSNIKYIQDIAVDHFRTIILDKYYHIQNNLQTILDKNEYSTIPINIKDAYLIYTEEFNINANDDLVHTDPKRPSKKERKGDLGSLFYLKATKLLNEYIKDFMPFENTPQAIKDFLEDLLFYFDHSPIIKPAFASIYTKIREVATDVYGTKIISPEFYTIVAKTFAKNLGILIQPSVSGLKLVWYESFRSHLKSGIVLDPSTLPTELFIVDDDFSSVGAKLASNLPSTYFEEQNSPFLWIHRKDKNTGKISNGIMKVNLLKNRLPNDNKHAYFEGHYTINEIINGIYFDDKDGKFLISRIGYDSINKEFFVKNVDWYKDKGAIRSQINYDEIIVLNGKEINIAELVFWRTSTKVTGNSITAFIQKVRSYVIPSAPYNPLLEASPKISKRSIIIDKIIDTAVKKLPPKLDFIPEQKTERDLIFISNIISELSRPFNLGAQDLFIIDNLFQISKEYQLLSSPSSTIKLMSKYSRNTMIQALKLMNPTNEMLNEMTLYRSELKIVEGKEREVLTRNSPTIKQFWGRWLERIQFALNNPQTSSPSFFSEFAHLKKFSFTTGPDLQVIENGKDDFRLIKLVREALIGIFSYEAFTLLDHGILSFSIDSEGNYQPLYKNHPRDMLSKILVNFKIGTLIDYKSLNPFGGGRGNIGSYTVTTSMWTSSLLLGHRQSLKGYYIDKNGVKTDYEQVMVSKPPSSMLNGLYEGYPSIEFSKSDVKFNEILINQFYNDYYSSQVPPLSAGSSDYKGTIKEIIEGRQILLELYQNMFFQRIANDDVFEHFTGQGLDPVFTRDVLLDYMILDFSEHIYSPRFGGIIDRDYIKVIKIALMQGGGSIQMGSSTLGMGHTSSPLFDATNPDEGKDGLKISIDFRSFTLDKLKKVIWTLHYDANFRKDFNRDIKQIRNIEAMIKDPIIHIYTMLYNTLKTYFNDYYQQSPRSKPRTTFAISFYRPGLGG
ncbi:MAG TPA: hypothetical protein ENI29_18240, partial [bacterium]|nr:hypothetical protein [bacterium]